MADLGALIDDFVAAAGPSRDLRAQLAHVVASDLALHDVASIGAEDVRALAGDLRAAGLSVARADAVVDALRLVFAYAVGRGLIRSSPLVGLAPVAPAGRPSPTTAIYALGENLVTWTMRAVVVGFVLAAIGLVVALA